MSYKLSYFRDNQLRTLKSCIGENISQYLSGEAIWSDFFGGEEFFRVSSIPIFCDIGSSIKIPEKGDLKDVENSKIVYEALKQLTPQQATDERVWAHFTHFDLWDYTRARWPISSGGDLESKKTWIKNHYFVSGNRGFYRNNSVSRLWWMGWMASRCEYYDLEKTLRIILYQQDVRKNLLERAGLSMSTEIFNAIMKRLGESYDGDKSLFDRKLFREFMKALNRKGGNLVLNSLDADHLDRILGEILSDLEGT